MSVGAGAEGGKVTLNQLCNFPPSAGSSPGRSAGGMNSFKPCFKFCLQPMVLRWPKGCYPGHWQELTPSFLHLDLPRKGSLTWRGCGFAWRVTHEPGAVPGKVESSPPEDPVNDLYTQESLWLPWQGHVVTAEHTRAYWGFPYKFKKTLSSLFTFNLAYHHVIRLKI